MKSIINTASDTVLLVALLVLFAIPVIVFGGFSPTTPKTELSAVSEQKADVLGVTSEAQTEKAGEKYLVELIPSLTNGMQIEELSRTSKMYEFSAFIPVSENGELSPERGDLSPERGDKNELLLKLVNTSTESQRIVLSLTDYADIKHLEYIELQLDNTRLDIEPLAQKLPLEPSITLQSGEWLSIGFKVSKDLPEPTVLTLQAKFLSE